LLHAGRHKDKYRAEKGSVPVLAIKVKDENVIVTRDEVHGYVYDPTFGFYLDCWQKTKLWGLPNGRGWANEATDIIDAITILEYESKMVEEEEIKKSQDKIDK